ncbi:hypothetical protein D3C72_2137300 [compost metagenome]
MVEVDEGLSHFIAAFIIGRVQVLAEGAGILDLDESTHGIVEQVQVGMGLQPLLQIGIVVQPAQAKEGFVRSIGPVAGLSPELQPGRL